MLQFLQKITSIDILRYKSKNKTAPSEKNLSPAISTSRHVLLPFLCLTTILISSIILLKSYDINQLWMSAKLNKVNNESQKGQTIQLENWVSTNSVDAETKSSIINERQKQWVSDWISKRYRVANEAVDMFVSAAYMTAHEIELDPLLILAVMAIESRFNPFAESPVGAQGLMQVMSKVHSEKFEDLGGIEAALDPVTNIRVGSRILKEYVTRGGSIEKGLKSYVGAAAYKTDFGYGAKVLDEYQKLKAVASGKKVSTLIAAKPAKQKKDALNSKQVSASDIIYDNPALDHQPLKQM